MSDKFHDKAKDAGNKLKANILYFSSVATGVFFFTLTGKELTQFSVVEKGLLLAAISFFAMTVLLCLLELYIDSQRFFEIARQMEKPEEERAWQRARGLKKTRKKMISGSYVTVASGFIITFIYMILRVT